MSLLTRCPACETLFKLVPDQLRISQGWVKCGHCGDIFDASKHLIQVAVEVPVPLEPPHSSEEADADVDSALQAIEDAVIPGTGAMPLADSDTAHAPSVDTLDTQWVALTEGAPDAAGCATPAPPEAVAADTTDAEATETLPPPAMEGVAEEHRADSTTGDPIADSEPTQGPTQQPEPDQALPQASFLGHPQPSMIWHRRSVQWFLALTVAVLGVGLLFQGFFWQRDQLAANYPALKPLLEQLCERLNCSVQPLKRMDAIAIDSVVFNRVNEGGYRLSFVLKNLAPLRLALPDVELTLTDAQEKVILRRVLSRLELFAGQQEILPAAELSVVLFLRLELGAPTPRDMGYRVLAFYP